jgi:hypothetical protein
MQNDIDLVSVSGEGFVDGVIDYLLGQVIWPGGVGVHTRALTHRLESREDLNIFGGILAHFME